jgi:hypothetical protein
MNIDIHWLGDDEIARIGRREPTTPFGRELLHRWGNRERGKLSSDTCRGCAVALAALFQACTTNGQTLEAVRQIVEDLGRSVPASRHFPPGSLRRRGVVLALACARQTATCSMSAAHAAATYEAEMIYAARRFAAARQGELAAYALV